MLEKNGERLMTKLLDAFGLAVIASLVLWGLIACGTPECFAGSQMSQPGHCIVPGGGSAGSGGKPNVVTRVIDEGPAAGAGGHKMPMVMEADEDAGTHPSLPLKVSEGDGAGGSHEDVSQPSCGDGLLADNETCDPMSKAHPCVSKDECRSTGCTVATYSGSPDTCDAKCETKQIAATKDGDGCCPKGADLATDNDCKPICGNGTLDVGESCDGNCAASCDDSNPCTVDRLIGSAEKCDALCVNSPVEAGTACGDNAYCSGDGKCLTNCKPGQPKCAGQPGTGSCVAASSFVECDGGGKVCVATWIPAGSTCGPGLTCDEQHNCN